MKGVIAQSNGCLQLPCRVFAFVNYRVRLENATLFSCRSPCPPGCREYERTLTINAGVSHKLLAGADARTETTLTFLCSYILT